MVPASTENSLWLTNQAWAEGRLKEVLKVQYIVVAQEITGFATAVVIIKCYTRISFTLLQGLLQKLKLMRSSTKHFKILEDVNIIIPPGRMTLLLGPPGSGKSTLLAALAGKLQNTNLKVDLMLLVVTP